MPDLHVGLHKGCFDGWPLRREEGSVVDRLALERGTDLIGGLGCTIFILESPQAMDYPSLPRFPRVINGSDDGRGWLGGGDV